MADAKKDLGEEMGDITPPGALVEKLDTSLFFDPSANHSSDSPIDQYLENAARLSLLYLKEPIKSVYGPDMGKLVLLGYMSAVESFLRAMVRGLVSIDECARKTAEPLEISYAAALHHDKTLLPEALLEGVSFASSAGVCKTLKEVCGIGGLSDNSTPALKKVFERYDTVCQLRHCCVHRFGRLGARNAQRLGMDEHSLLLEKPINISVDQLQEIAAVLQRFVAAVNSYVFEDVLKRSVECSPTLPKRLPHRYKSRWTFVLADDKDRFERYYKLFACTKPSPASPTMAELYDGFCRWANAVVVAESRRGTK